MPINVGFTGTRYGMTNKQLWEVAEKLEDINRDRNQFGATPMLIRFHHGDCKGADAQMHNYLLSVRPPWLSHIYVYPPTNDKWRAFCTGPRELVTILLPMPYLIRNREIVDVADYIIAAPKHNRGRGGTWWTINYAREAEKGEGYGLTILPPK